LYWPAKDDAVSFYAYSPAASVNVNGFSSQMNDGVSPRDNALVDYLVPNEPGPTITGSKPSGAKLPEDFLIAVKKQALAKGDTVRLDFRHALSMATFAARNTTKDLNVTIEKVQLINLDTHGKLDLAQDFSKDDIYWVDQSSTADYTAGIPLQSDGSYAISLPPKGPNSSYISLTAPTEQMPVLPQGFYVGSTSRHILKKGEAEPTSPGILVTYRASTTLQIVASPGTRAYYPFPALYQGNNYQGKPDFSGVGNLNSFAFQMGKRYQFTFDFDGASYPRIEFSVGSIDDYDSTQIVPTPPALQLLYEGIERTTMLIPDDEQLQLTAGVIHTNQQTWTAEVTSGKGWLTVDSPMGYDGETLRFSARKNTTNLERTGTITLYADTAKRVLTITQKVAPANSFSLPGIDLWIQNSDQPAGYNWFIYTNTLGNICENSEPPFGAHIGYDKMGNAVNYVAASQNPNPVANSCAAIPSDDPTTPWRLPTYVELKAIYSAVSNNPVSDKYGFNINSGYWSASTDCASVNGTGTLDVSFSDGSALGGGKAVKTQYRARCVRDKEAKVLFLPDGTPAGTPLDLNYILVPGSSNQKDRFTVNFIPKQTFTMGNGSQGDNPMHKVTLTKNYYLSPYQVTNAQFAAFLNDKGVGSNGLYEGVQIVRASAGSNNWGLTYSDGRWTPVNGYDLFPIIYVSWNGANAYAAWLTIKLGKKISGYKVSIPTESQWECANRAGTAASGEGSVYPWGASWNDKYGWIRNNSGGHTHEVGTATSSGWGLYDMSGNVWEWCSDWYGSLNTTATNDPIGATSGSERVIRGGYWDNLPSSGCLMAAFRNHVDPSTWSSFAGFRVCIVPE
jgi:formylglycine-generating enzyme required for sulfatase activity